MTYVPDPNETQEGQLRRAYSLGLKLKNSGLDEEVIYARLEKQGISEEVAKEVAANISIQRKEDLVKEEQPFYYSALVKVGAGILIAIVSLIVAPDQIIIPVGFILGGIILAISSKQKIK
ncbi:hypothetical protein Oweho_0881 [Owenweeksia hongkongensis DSM 17368]|uniref:Uncharacterized protein n=1 Tax=Owenweeksia hongkongensis (strain DSM 17368 / CIP 108786 / JCM 12287 / NRRL B-23963 / UST20020801) TaxID=926562 RepID=G8R2T7_OWEHD|nr:hypothetical protein [Owenweeksia hongkongensis]AEV31892.1 hypothetical protein Oweho_0881 [Owenweeksia hongkongensis DSM 17368]